MKFLSGSDSNNNSNQTLGTHASGTYCRFFLCSPVSLSQCSLGAVCHFLFSLLLPIIALILLSLQIAHRCCFSFYFFRTQKHGQRPTTVSCAE